MRFMILTLGVTDLKDILAPRFATVYIPINDKHFKPVFEGEMFSTGVDPVDEGKGMMK